MSEKNDALPAGVNREKCNSLAQEYAQRIMPVFSFNEVTIADLVNRARLQRKSPVRKPIATINIGQYIPILDSVLVDKTKLAGVKRALSHVKQSHNYVNFLDDCAKQSLTAHIKTETVRNKVHIYIQAILID